MVFKKKEGKKNLVDDVDLSFRQIPVGPKSVRHNRSLHLAGNVKEFMNQQLNLMLLTFFLQQLLRADILYP